MLKNELLLFGTSTTFFAKESELIDVEFTINGYKITFELDNPVRVGRLK